VLYVAIDHPAIACIDVRAQVDWYCTNLGMRVVADNGQTPPSIVIGYGPTTREGAMIEMIPARDPGPRPDAFGRFQPGLRHLAFRVTDFDEALSKLKALGVVFTMGEPGEALGGGRTILFRDPEGNELQIVQR
jgi:catechol 2,3-dioxygenase-like lactoylglutathione lyase family enzyme